MFTPFAFIVPEVPSIPSAPYIEATGGTITIVGDYKYHTFTSVATSSFTITAEGSAPNNVFDFLVVAGGGSGGGDNGGGGGAGGYISVVSESAVVGTYDVVVGAGGVVESPGANSSFYSQVAIGGGKGGGNLETGGTGGSGGGGGYYVSGRAGGTATSGQGFNGGTGILSTVGGGGGGASEAGNTDASGYGGDGKTWLNGTTYAGGGGGASDAASTQQGGTGGGGNGCQKNTGNGSAGENGKGGGGGSGDTGYAAYNGGSGVVIIRYKGAGIVTDNLAFYIDPANGNFNDTIYGKTGTQNGTITTVDSNYWSGFGVSNWISYASMANINDNTDASYTWEQWVYFASDWDAASVKVAMAASSDTVGQEYRFRYLGSDNGNNIQMSIPQYIDTNVASASSYKGAWSHHVGVYNYNGSTASSTLKYSVRLVGGSEAENTITGFSGTGVTRPYGGILKIGQSTNDTVNFSGGYVGPTRIYNSALTDEQITQNYDWEKSRFGG